MRRAYEWVVVALMCCGCEAEKSEAPTGARQDVAVRRAALRGEAPDEEAIARWSAAREPGEELLAVWQEGALIGRPLPAPELSDMARLMQVRQVGEGAKAITPGLPLEDVARTSTGELYAVSVDHELVKLNAEGAVSQVLEGPVQGPLSLSSDGKKVAYLRGDAPALSPVVRDLTSGEVRQVPTLQFAWSAALSPDATWVSFVEGGERAARLVRVRLEDGQREELDTAGEVPMGPRAAIWAGGAVLFEGSEGLVLRTPAGSRAMAGRLPIALDGAPGRALVHVGEGVQVVTLGAQEVGR